MMGGDIMVDGEGAPPSPAPAPMLSWLLESGSSWTYVLIVAQFYLFAYFK
jgi:hypothetical protein